MEPNRPTKPVRAKRTPLEIPPNEVPQEELEEDTNKYAKRSKIGKPTIGRQPNYVETVGLGNLTTVTAHGNL